MPSTGNGSKIILGKIWDEQCSRQRSVAFLVARSYSVISLYFLATEVRELKVQMGKSHWLFLCKNLGLKVIMATDSLDMFFRTSCGLFLSMFHSRCRQMTIHNKRQAGMFMWSCFSFGDIESSPGHRSSDFTSETAVNLHLDHHKVSKYQHSLIARW